MIIVLTLLSGLADSQGFIHSAQVWRAGRLIPEELVKSGLGYAIGIGAYWFAIKYLQIVGITSAEVQTLGWFAVTIIGVAIASGQFIQWKPPDQFIAIIVIMGIGLLMFRTGG